MAHTFDTKSLVAASAATTINLTYTCGATATLLVVGVASNTGTARTGGTPTYNGVALSLAGGTQTQANPAGCFAELWYMIAPPQGQALTISVPNSGGNTVSVVASSFISATGMTALDTSGGNNGVSANPSVSVTTAWPSGGDVTVDLFSSSNGATPTAGQTLLDAGANAGGHSYGAQYNLQGNAAGAVAMSWTQGTAKWALCVASFNEVNHNTLMMTGGLT